LLAGCTFTEAAGRNSALEPERHIVELVNLHRESQGLSRLQWDGRLARIARVHSEGIAGGARPFSHAGLAARARQALVDEGELTLGENLFSVQPGSSLSVWRAVAGWLESPPHRAQLEGCYDYTGVGVATGPGGHIVFTQLFALRVERGRRAPRCAPRAGIRESASGASNDG
jgi:uncharacterized protein YkwD